MQRRSFLHTLGLASVGAALPGSVTGSPAEKPSSDAARPAELRMLHRMLFWDFTRFDHTVNLELKLGTPVWRPEGTYLDPHLQADSALSCHWNGVGGSVYWDETARAWRSHSVYITRKGRQDGLPKGHVGIFVSESADGVRWAPAQLPEIKPEVGPKLTPHHVATIESGVWGGFYQDPLVTDGWRFKTPYLQWGHSSPEVVTRAASNPQHPGHKLVNSGKLQSLIDERSFLVSADGLRWKIERSYAWNMPGWHPEEPVYTFYNPHTREHCLLPRAGWGDRRVCLMKSKDFKSWSPPRVVMQPDALDERVLEFYTMPAGAYGDGFVGLVWAAEFGSSEPPEWGVRSFGPTVGQLAWSPDGEIWTRPSRATFLPLNPAPEPGCGMIRPERFVEQEREIRIYSNAWPRYHGHPEESGLKVRNAMLLHTLRKDGFMFLEPSGAWGEFITKKLTLFSPTLKVNADAQSGEVRFQFSNIRSQPLPGFTFADCVPLKDVNAFQQPIAFQNKADLRELVGQGVRLHVKMQGARLYAFEGDFRFLDAYDLRLLEAGAELEPLAVYR